jgi:hypothetical protein
MPCRPLLFAPPSPARVGRSSTSDAFSVDLRHPLTPEQAERLASLPPGFACALDGVPLLEVPCVAWRLRLGADDPA